MLYRDFNELDNDYITIWSRRFLDYPIEEVKKYLRPLAELGQVNALQCFYLTREKGEMLSKAEKYFTRIDEYNDANGENSLKRDFEIAKLSKFLNAPSDFDLNYARFRRLESYANTGETLTDEEKNIADLLHKWYEIVNNRPNEHCDDEDKIIEYNSMITLLRTRLKRTRLIKLYTELTENAFDGSQNSGVFKKIYNKPLIERMLNLQRAYSLILEYWTLRFMNRGALKSYFEKYMRISMRELKQALKTDPENPVLKYLYARQIYLKSYAKLGHVKLVEQASEKKIFEELASRELSKTLTDYMSKNNEKSNEIDSKLEENIDNYEELTKLDSNQD